MSEQKATVFFLQVEGAAVDQIAELLRPVLNQFPGPQLRTLAPVIENSPAPLPAIEHKTAAPPPKRPIKYKPRKAKAAPAEEPDANEGRVASIPGKGVIEEIAAYFKSSGPASCTELANALNRSAPGVYAAMQRGCKQRRFMRKPGSNTQYQLDPEFES
jgi:hypothetical protein